MKKENNIIYNIVIVSLFAAIIVISAWISFPFGSIPITLQTLAVFTAGALLGFKRGFATITLYIMLGIVGLPVFHGFTGGPGMLMGSTGGFIWGLLFSVIVIAALYNKNVHGIKRLALALLIAQIVCYICGTAWFCFVYAKGQGIIGAFFVTVVPFLLPDALKIFATVFLVKRVAKYVK